MIYNLSQTQLGIYATCLNTNEEGSYNLDSLHHLDDSVDLSRLAQSLDAVIEAHPYVKSRIVTDENGDPFFEDHSDEAFHTPIIEVESIDKVRNSFGADFDLLHDRLFRLEIYKTTEEGNYLYVDFHHIIFDGASFAIFCEDLAKAYDTGAEIPVETVNGFQIAENELEMRKSDFYLEAKDWYQKEFGGASELDSMPLPDIYSDDEEHFVKLWKKLDVDTEALTAFCERMDTKESTVYTAAFGYTLSKYTADDEVLYTTVFHGRTDKASRQSFCMMVKTLPVYHNLQQLSTVADLLHQTREQSLSTRKYDVYSFADAHNDLGINANVSFVYQGALHDTSIILDGRRQHETSLITHTPGFKFLGMLMMEENVPYIWCEYQSNKFTSEFVDGFWESYTHVVNEMCHKEMLADIEMCTPRQIEQLDSFNAHFVPKTIVDETVLSAFRKAAKQYPNNTAVVFCDKKITYRELDELTDSIGVAIYKKCRDIRPCASTETPVVSILIERSEWMAILPLAAMKAGCAYQPLDPSYPEERLNFMVKDADAALLIADPSLRDIITEYQGDVVLTSDLIGLPSEVDSLPDTLTPTSLFILLYTSGSTGVPKGVMLEHQNLMEFCQWYHRYYDLQSEHRVAAYASFGFDACMMDLYPALTRGAAVVIVPEEKRLDLIALGEYFEQNGVTHSFITTQVGVQFLQNVEGCTSLKHLSVGGEKLVSVDPANGYIFHNGYGPTECTIFTTTLPVLKNEPNIPIGKPTDALRCYVMDKHMHRLPVGASGELIIVGRQVGRGYLNRPDKTAEAFFTMDGERAYHSGDIVRYRADGNIEFVGRKDGQVKIRGFRIELKEVEAVIREFPAVKDCTVQAFDDPNGGKFIAAYVVSDVNPLDVDALNAFILDRKPPYMVPAHTMQIEKIPLNVNQKVDKKALPKPEIKESKENDAVAAPLNALELQLKDIISAIIKTEDFGITEPLAYLGLTSITSIKLAVQIFKKYGVQLDSKTLAKTGTLQSIENEILSKFLTPCEAEVVTKQPAEQTSDVMLSAPLSFTQQGVYTECMTNPEAVIYNMPMCLSFPKDITAERIQSAVQKVLEAHPYMACHFVAGDQDEVVQQPIDDFKPEITVRQLSDNEFDEYKQTFVRPFNLAEGPLFRFEIIKAGGTCHLLMDIHHLIGDGASVDLFTHQICEVLNHKEIEVETYDYYHFVHDQKMDDAAEAYFDQTIGGIEEVSRLSPDIFEDNQNHTPHSLSVKMSGRDIDDFTRTHNITPAAFFLAATSLTVSRYLCEEDISIATISNGRSNLLVNNTMGMFVNTLPIAMHITTHDAVDTLLANASAALEQAILHESYPFARIASKYGFMPSISYACQLGVLDSLHTMEGDVTMETLNLGKAKLPIAIYVNGSLDDEVELVVEYDSGLYTNTMMKHFVTCLRNVSSSLISNTILSDISITTEEDWHQLDTFNPEFFADYDMSDTAVTLFRKQVERYPDKTAAVYKDKRYTYRELDEMTDRLAQVIHDRVTRITGKDDLREKVVSIIIDRNEWVFLLPIAVLKTGCAYEPLDPSYPATRLNFMVKDAKACLLLGQSELVSLVDEYQGEILLTDELESVLNTSDVVEMPRIEVKDASALMLMLYTSGSTGQPKGVQIEHRNIIAFVKGVEKAGFYGADSHVAAYASFGFDVCMMDIFCTLLNGGTLFVIPEDMRLELSRLKEYMDTEDITQIFMTTQVGVQFLQNYPQMKSLRTLSMGGEKLPAVHPEGLSYRILNGYGPTENTCGVSQFVIKHWEPNIPLGKPMPTVLGYILDKSGHRLPPGANGEYCVAGYQPARGYLGLPEKTAEVFVDLPEDMNPTDRKDLRLYHTGDIVRYRENGDVEFVGRKDGMVKIRGFRIELKEVEAAIRPFEGVADVTVQAYDYESGGKYLAAFVVAKEGTLDTDALLAFVKSQKPPYMVPAIVIQIDKIPLTVNQKVDKKALPKPQLAAAAYVAPKGRVEEDFCEIYAEVLGQEKVSAASDFFEIGGSSIIALKVVIAAEKRGYAIVYNDVFTYTTPQLMAEHLGDTGQQDTASDESSITNSEISSYYGPGIKEDGPDGFDYRSINALLRGNTMQAFQNGERQPLGDVLLAGATGFLGIHVLKDLIDNYDNRIYCFIRSKGEESAEDRLKQLLIHYFGDDFAGLFGERIFIVEGDATDPKALDGFAPEKKPFTVVNCAASVKHFAKGNEIELVNVTSVRNLVAWCIRHDVRLVHVSTGSVMGVYINPSMPEGFVYDEHMLYVGQTIDDNQYVHSKFMAERLIYEAILHHGLNAKVMRVGNLAPRDSDGKFQINYQSNNFMASLAAYRHLGMIPYEQMDGLMEFSPIDKVAHAILLLATTPKECVCFMPSNHYRPHMGDILKQFEAFGREMRMVEAEEFQSAVAEAMSNPDKVDLMRPFMVYADNGPAKRPLGPDVLNVNYTVQVLYRLGFCWPKTGDDYVQRFMGQLKEYFGL